MEFSDEVRTGDVPGTVTGKKKIYRAAFVCRCMRWERGVTSLFHAGNSRVDALSRESFTKLSAREES